MILAQPKPHCNGPPYPRARVPGAVPVRTPCGAALCFPHGGHPLHARHAGEEVTSGRKYMARTEILYKRTAAADRLQAQFH